MDKLQQCGQSHLKRLCVCVSELYATILQYYTDIYHICSACSAHIHTWTNNRRTGKGRVCTTRFVVTAYNTTELKMAPYEISKCYLHIQLNNQMKIKTRTVSFISASTSSAWRFKDKHKITQTQQMANGMVYTLSKTDLELERNNSWNWPLIPAPNQREKE